MTNYNNNKKTFRQYEINYGFDMENFEGLKNKRRSEGIG